VNRVAYRSPRERQAPVGAYVVGYCDGSCPKTDGPGGWGYIFHDGPDQFEACGGVNVATNNTMELRAAIEILAHLDDFRLNKRPIVVCCDSQYVINGLHEWRNKWERNDFLKVKNVEIWKELFALHDRFEHCSFVWIRGHVGHYWNEYVDRLAARGRKTVEIR
jgi:ribonuclease HI